MAKMSLEEFKNKYNEKIVDNDDLLIELFEDVEDSFNYSNDEELENLKEEIAKKEVEVEELKKKYKERFLTSTEEKDEEEKEEVLEEKEVIDIKDI